MDFEPKFKFNTKLLTAYMHKNNLSKKEFCNVSKIWDNTYNTIMQGITKNIRSIVAFRLCKLLDVYIIEILIKTK